MRAGLGERIQAAGRMRERRRAAGGFTLLEMLVALAVLGVLTVLAVPAYNEARARARVKGVANNLQMDLQYARSEAVQRNAAAPGARVWVSFAVGTNWCYGIHQGAAACDCTVANACSIKVVNAAQAATTDVSMSGATFGGNAFYSINPRRGQIDDGAGTPVTGTIDFTGAGSKSLRTEVNAVGRARLCSPSGTIGGFPSC